MTKKGVDSWVVTDEFWQRVETWIPVRECATGKTYLVRRKASLVHRSKHLCADAGYRGQWALGIINEHGYIPHVVDRRTEARMKRRDPQRRALRWVVEVCHSWFNRFRKLPVRYEKLERRFVALNHLAAAIIAFRKVPLTVNIIYG